MQDKGDGDSRRGSVTSAKSGSGSDTSSLEEKPVKSDKDLTIYEILERRVATQTVIDILRDEEDFKVGYLTAYSVSSNRQNSYDNDDISQ